MAPKSLSKSRSSKKEEELERPPSSEERGDEQESEEEDSSSEEDEDPSEEEEDQKKEPQVPPKPTQQENGSESEPESDDSPSAYKMQPITKTPAAASKRKTEEIGNGDISLITNKRTKSDDKSDLVAPSTPRCITRLWNNDDEAALLNGMVEFKKSKNTDFGGGFYDIIKGKLQFDFSREQFRTKINRFRKRFFNSLKKGQNGLDPVFSKPHDVLVFELSKKIWGGESGNKNDSGEGVGKNPKKDTGKKKKIEWEKEDIAKNKDDRDEGLMWSNFEFLCASFDNFAGKFPSLAMSDSGMSLVKEKLSLIGNLKAKELNEEWKQLVVEETELHYRKLSLMREQIALALD